MRKSLAKPQPHRSFEHRGTECVPPITEGRTVKINAGFTSGQRVQKVLSFLMTDKTVNIKKIDANLRNYVPSVMALHANA